MGSPGSFSESLPVERSGCQPMLSAARTGVGLGGACSRGVGGAHSPAGGRGAQMGSCDPGQLGVEWARGPDGQSSLRSPSGDDRQHGCPSEGSLDPAPRRGSPVLMQPPRAMSPRTWRQNRSLWWGQLTPGPSRGGGLVDGTVGVTQGSLMKGLLTGAGGIKARLQHPGWRLGFP